MEHYRMKQMGRIIKMLFMINKDPTWTRPQLAAHFGVNKGTIQRDINLCREMGIEIEVDGKQGYYIKKGFKELIDPPTQKEIKDA